MKKIILLALTMMALLVPNKIFAQTDVNPLVNQYGCEALYIVQTPNDVHFVVRELLGYTPLPQTIDNYTKTLITEKVCTVVDTNQIIWNVCGSSGDKNTICDEWKKTTNLYKKELVYNLYYRKASASNSVDWTTIPQFIEEKEEVLVEGQSQSVEQKTTSIKTINFIPYIISLILLVSTGIFIWLQINKRKGSQNVLNADDYINSSSIDIKDLME